MPRYRKRRGKKIVHKPTTFDHPYQMIHFLSTATESEFAPLREKANDYLNGVETPPIPLRRRALQQIATQHPRKLVKHAVDELNRNDMVGGGISSGVAVLLKEFGHLLGLDVIANKITGVKKQKLQSLDSQFAAYLVDQSYKKQEDREETALGKFKRLTKYDTDITTVWQNVETNELTVAVRGTKMNAKDLLQDVGILFGNTQTKSKILYWTQSKKTFQTRSMISPHIH